MSRAEDGESTPKQWRRRSRFGDSLHCRNAKLELRRCHLVSDGLVGQRSATLASGCEAVRLTKNIEQRHRIGSEI
jgi:hypothetical protein